MNAARERIPLWLVTGWLGSGKTTLLAQWLRDPALADAAVVVNELGEVGLDDRLLAASVDSGAGAALLAGGCVCCTGLPGLEQALADLFWDRLHRRRPRFSSVVVETTGLADPRPVVEALARDPLLAERYRLAGVITTVAATAAHGVLEAHPEARAQLAAADLVVVTKADLAPAAHALGAVAALRPDAVTLTSARASLGWAEVCAAVGQGPHGAAQAAHAAADEPGGGHGHAQHPAAGTEHAEHADHADHAHVHATFIALPDALTPSDLHRRIAEALSPPPWRLKGAARLDDGRWVSVQWSAGDTAAAIGALEGPPPRAGLTRIDAAD